jgi:hypothetical protein
MKEASAMSKPMNCETTTNAISSPASADGHSRSGSLDGLTKNLSGLAHVRVSRFRALDSEKAMPTNDTCGPLFIGSSPSANLQRCLENRLLALTDVNGSPEYALTWKEQDMPSGLPICALRASAPRIEDKGFIGWPTPKAMDSREHQSLDMYLARMARHPRDMTTITNLTMLVKLIGWCSPTAQDHSRGVKPPRPQDTGIPLSQQVSGLMPKKSKCVTHAQAKDASGGLVLNPYFSLWLMGYNPRAWMDCAARAMQSCRKSGRCSSKRRATDCANNRKP